MTSETSSPTLTDAPTLSETPLVITTLQRTRKMVEFHTENTKTVFEDQMKIDRDPERCVCVLLLYS